MKEPITKFDLEAAFKALDEIDVPKAGKVKANRPALTEIFSRKTKLDTLMEEYYDISNPSELEDAQEAREAEVAKAKLARIEKIVDLDADSPEDLLTSYVGKFIMQCPQCMTLFYKDEADVVKSEEDPDTVNVNEVCQHCGNESGYTLVGKVGEAAPGEFAEEETEVEITDEEGVEEPVEEESLDDLDSLDDLGELEELDLDLDDSEEEKTEESFTTHYGESLVEELADDADLDDKLEAHSEYIEYLRTAIAQEEEKLEKSTNEQVKVAIQRNIDAFKADLEIALPDAVKNDTATAEEAPEEPEQNEPEEPTEDVEVETETQEESCETDADGKTLTESLHEDADLEVSDAEFAELIDSPEFKKPISDTDVRNMFNDEKEEEVEESLTEGNIFDLAKNAVKGVVNTVKGAANIASVAIDKLGEIVKTREEKANWILQYALKDYKQADFNDKGAPAKPDDGDRKFNIFLVVGFNEKNSHRQVITRPQEYNTKGLIPEEVKEKYEFKEADSFAKGWSMGEGQGPAFIYLAKDKNDKEAVFLCEYFKGKLEFDQVGNYFKSVRQYWESAWRTSDIKPVPAFKKNAPMRPAFESMSTIIENLDDMHDASLESMISNSLVETYQNVAGYRLSSCEFIDNNLLVEGVVYFTSGNTRNITYKFSHGQTEGSSKIKLYGLNEKLGSNHQFILTGHTNNDKTLITESFSREQS